MACSDTHSILIRYVVDTIHDLTDVIGRKRSVARYPEPKRLHVDGRASSPRNGTRRDLDLFTPIPAFIPYATIQRPATSIHSPLAIEGVIGRRREHPTRQEID